MSDTGKQLGAWRGNFGDAYIERNRASEDRLRLLTLAYAEILRRVTTPLGSILEVGSNIGNNLQALSRLTSAELYAVEPNAKARKTLIEQGIVDKEKVFDGTAGSIPLPDKSVDLVFTSGVLIHVPEASLPAAYREMHRISRRYLLTVEYFSPTPVSVPYRGETDLLFKRDFGGMWLELFAELEPVATGFFWRRTTGLDDLNWWLFRKP